MFASKSARFFGKYAASDPIKFPDMVRRRLIERFSATPEGLVATNFRAVKYEIDMDTHRLMRKYYFHTHEMFLERIFDRHLSPGNVFVDIGANCGYWSAYALSRVGNRGEVHAFEPVPHYFAFVRRLSEINPKFRVFANPVACGAQSAQLPMAVVPPRRENFENYNTNIGSSSLAPGFLDHAKALTENITVDVIRFDDYVASQNLDLDRVGLIKIDVEGFESAVFDGMRKTLEKPGRKVPILCEILTDRTRAQPLDGAAIIARLERVGYQCLDATNLKPIDKETLGFEENILCV
ncbi:FkbM family methyltransferase [Microbacteriaceae bacterium K1510]|nr:FkbM family methyltransferase [Microbacteriaceae bacterium K1510]